MTAAAARQEVEARPDHGAGTPPLSQQVSWFETYTFAAMLAASHDVVLDNLPLAGTPQWCGMPDTDARKLLALVLGGVREALTNDCRQADLADASREIASAAAWSRLGRGRGNAYIPRKAS